MLMWRAWCWHGVDLAGDVACDDAPVGMKHQRYECRVIYGDAEAGTTVNRRRER